MEKIINVFGKTKSQILSRFNEGSKTPCVILEAIDKETEDKIDAIIKYGGGVKLQSGHIITKNDIYVYGDINLKSKADIEYLNKFKKLILNPYTMCTFIPESFNYERGIYVESNNIAKGSNFQSNYLTWFKWNYCHIGKPRKIIIYHYPNRK